MNLTIEVRVQGEEVVSRGIGEQFRPFRSHDQLEYDKVQNKAFHDMCTWECLKHTLQILREKENK